MHICTKRATFFSLKFAIATTFAKNSLFFFWILELGLHYFIYSFDWILRKIEQLIKVSCDENIVNCYESVFKTWLIWLKKCLEKSQKHICLCETFIIVWSLCEEYKLLYIFFQLVQSRKKILWFPFNLDAPILTCKSISRCKI